jgi:hypothetical protein
MIQNYVMKILLSMSINAVFTYTTGLNASIKMRIFAANH